MDSVEKDAKLSLVQAQVGLVFRLIKSELNSEDQVRIPVDVSGIGLAATTKGQLYLTKETAKRLFCGFKDGQLKVVKNKENNLHRVLTTKKFLVEIGAFDDFKANSSSIMSAGPALSVSRIVYNLLIAHSKSEVFSDSAFSFLLSREFSCFNEKTKRIEL